MLKHAFCLAALMGSTNAVLAQDLSDDMTCAEAIDHFERTGEINIMQDGQVLPITQGTPIRKADMLNCTGNGMRFETMVKTRDDPQCVIAAYCG
jgi:hypothetical protein